MGTRQGTWPGLHEPGSPWENKHALPSSCLALPPALSLWQTLLHPSESHSGSTSSRETPISLRASSESCGLGPHAFWPQKEKLSLPHGLRVSAKPGLGVPHAEPASSGTSHMECLQSDEQACSREWHPCPPQMPGSQHTAQPPPSRTFKKSARSMIPFIESSRTGQPTSAVRGGQGGGDLRGQSDWKRPSGVSGRLGMLCLHRWVHAIGTEAVHVSSVQLPVCHESVIGLKKKTPDQGLAAARGV